MVNRTANILGVLGLAVADRIERTTREILNHSGETPAALVVIGYGLGPSNDELRRILGLSHSGCVRLVDRLVTDGLVVRRVGKDKRAVALYLTDAGEDYRTRLLSGRLSEVRAFLNPLTEPELETLASLLHKLLSAMETTDLERCRLCRFCDDSVCSNCPIPAEFKSKNKGT